MKKRESVHVQLEKKEVGGDANLRIRDVSSMAGTQPSFLLNQYQQPVGKYLRQRRIAWSLWPHRPWPHRPWPVACGVWRMVYGPYMTHGVWRMAYGPRL